jgi:hypothetical protein
VVNVLEIMKPYLISKLIKNQKIFFKKIQDFQSYMKLKVLEPDRYFVQYTSVIRYLNQ